LRLYRQELCPRDLHAGRPLRAARGPETLRQTEAHVACRSASLSDEQGIDRRLQCALLCEAVQQAEERAGRLRALLLSPRFGAPLEPCLRQTRSPAVPVRAALGTGLP